MNNAARAIVQDRLIAAAWLRLAGALPGGRVLEIGCGRGVGASIARGALGAGVVYGLDLDPKMLRSARRRGTGRLVQADAIALPLGDCTLDAVVDFGAIHLVPDWPKALREVRRVLKEGGRYYFEWVTLPLVRVGYRLGADGFKGMPAPRADRVLQTLDEVGLPVENRVLRRRFWAFGQLAGDLIGVGRAA